MQFKQYPSYKDSGVEWLGDVPEHWQVKPNKYVFKIQKRIAGTLGFNVLSITQKGLKIKDIESNAGQMAQDYSKYQIVNVGDFAMNHMDLLTGWIDIAKVTGVTSPDYRVFEVRNKKVNKEYFLHLFQLGYRNKILFAFGQGAAQMGRWRLQSETFNTLKMPFPSIEEQQKIVAFLNTETARIDTLIVKQEKLIELLEEQRKSIISHVVTKGLNPNAPMKDSGVEWLGEVPEHWNILKSSYIFKVSKGKNAALLTKEYCATREQIYPVYSGQTENSGLMGMTDSYEYDCEENGGILSTTVGAKAMSVKYLDHKFNLSQNCMIIFSKNNDVYNNKFYYYFFQPLFHFYRNQIPDFMQPSFRMEDFYSYKIVSLTLDEQKKIVEYLDFENQKFDNLISKQQTLIEKLKEYRASIISHAVTGKIDVREFTA